MKRYNFRVLGDCIEDFIIASIEPPVIYVYCLFPIDIDECTEGTASCDSNSTCINTVGSYMCQCKEGFIHPPGLQQTCIGNDQGEISYN